MENWRNKPERNKLYLTLAHGLGETMTTWKDRSRISKKALPKVEAWDMSEFKKSMKQITFPTLKVNHGEETYYL